MDHFWVFRSKIALQNVVWPLLYLKLVKCFHLLSCRFRLFLSSKTHRPHTNPLGIRQMLSASHGGSHYFFWLFYFVVLTCLQLFLPLFPTNRYLLSPFPLLSPWLTFVCLFWKTEADDVEEAADQLATEAKRIYLVDSGLVFNSPYPLLLRPQRAVDIFLSFDFSAREKDDEMPFKVS